jgi:hypothetical protein
VKTALEGRWLQDVDMKKDVTAEWTAVLTESFNNFLAALKAIQKVCGSQGWLLWKEVNYFHTIFIHLIPSPVTLLSEFLWWCGAKPELWSLESLRFTRSNFLEPDRKQIDRIMNLVVRRLNYQRVKLHHKTHRSWEIFVVRPYYRLLIVIVSLTNNLSSHQQIWETWHVSLYWDFAFLLPHIPKEFENW